MKKQILFVLLLVILLLGCSGKEGMHGGNIQYDIRFPNAAHNEAEITLTLTNLDPIPAQISMSRSSPGRYALHEFAKNIYDVLAVDGRGDTLETYQPDLHSWILSGHDGTIKFSYTLYGDHADGTYDGINREHAHLNSPATYVWLQGLEEQSMTVRFHPPEGSDWKVATQLKPTNNPYTFTAPNLYYLMDSPTELSSFDLEQWTVRSDTTNYTMRLAMHHNGTHEEFENYVKMAQKIVNEEKAVYGALPHYDYGTYTFLIDYLPYVYGDGMEHRNSTVITGPHPLSEGALQNLYTLSHEYFHCWNVERIRPNSLEPFSFEEANVSGALWFAEGFTSYYDDLMIRRAGFINDKEYGEGWSGTLNYVLNSPGSNFYNAVEMSMQAPFVDAATSIDEQNKSNTFISYYSWGSVLGLGLDLMLRTTFENISLDDYMQAMWKKFGKPEMPYRLIDLKKTLAEVTDSTKFADMFFSKYIYGSNLIDLKPLLAKAGFLLRKEYPGQAIISFGAPKIDYRAAGATISENTIIGSPLYKAGIDREDMLLKLDGKLLRDARDMNRILNIHKPGDALMVVFKSLTDTVEATITLAEDPTLEMVSFEQVGMKLKSETKTFRENWLESKVQK